MEISLSRRRVFGQTSSERFAYVVILSVQFNIVLVAPSKQIVRPQHLRDLDKLIRVAIAVEERFFPEDHRREHSAQRPHVERVIVFLEVNEKLGAFEVP